MALQRLYGLDKTFPDKLDELLHDGEYVKQLHALPESDLSQLVDHLNEVGFSTVTRGPADRFTFADRRPPQSHWRIIQKMPPGFAQDMWQSKSPPFRFRVV